VCNIKQQQAQVVRYMKQQPSSTCEPSSIQLANNITSSRWYRYKTRPEQQLVWVFTPNSS
jgi:hypothetical protein